MLFFGHFRNLTHRLGQKLCKRNVSYVQGQEPEPKIREYFYYIDHQGMLFLDDSKMKNFTSCFKEKKFLDFFFKRIRLNTTERYRDSFPFISLCGRERNFIRCDDVPIVYTHLKTVSQNGQNTDLLYYGYAGSSLVNQFIPEKIYMFPDTGRVYHPAEAKYGGVGLIRSKLSIELSKHFEFENGEHSPPSHFTWKGTRYCLDQLWLRETLILHKIKIREHI